MHVRSVYAGWYPEQLLQGQYLLHALLVSLLSAWLSVKKRAYSPSRVGTQAIRE